LCPTNVRVLRRIFGPGEKVTGGWRKSDYKELLNLYSSSNIIRMMKSRTKWAGHVASMAAMTNAYRLLVRNLKGRHHSEDPGVHHR
jgi:hypothetical protein